MNPVHSPPLKKTPFVQNPAEEEERTGGTNDRALTMKLSLGKRSFLLPSDISQIVESRLAESGRDLRSDVLIVPHHGSRFSSSESFLERVAPRVAIVSCGYKNVFKFPHREILHRYRLMHIDLYRTDLDGAVRATTDGRNITVESLCAGSCEGIR
jgi:competence protein ComEC